MSDDYIFIDWLLMTDWGDIVLTFFCIIIFLVICTIVYLIIECRKARANAMNALTRNLTGEDDGNTSTEAPQYSSVPIVYNPYQATPSSPPVKDTPQYWSGSVSYEPNQALLSPVEDDGYGQPQQAQASYLQEQM